jgi:hypothetical protein
MTIDGYYYDGKKAWIFYKKKCGKIIMRRWK